MAGSVAELRIKIGANSYEFNKAVQDATKSVQKMGADMQRIGKSMSLYLTAPIVALGALSVKAYDTQIAANVKVQQALKSTANAARLTANELTNFASELQNKTIFGDEEILDKSTAQLLTFTNIVGENFKRAQRVALDLTTVLNGDLQGASIQLGKALNDPVRSLSALRKSGIQFSDVQEEVIKKLAKTGQVAQAQSLMLDELERQYGGQAEARAKAGLGPLIQLKNAWGDFMEQIGEIILPHLNKLVGALMSMVKWLQNLSPSTKRLIVSIAGLAAAIGPALIVLGAFAKLIPLIKIGFSALIAPITGVKTAINALTTAIKRNPLGILVTVVTSAIALFLSFNDTTEDVVETHGELTAQITEESKQVNTLIAKLSSATTAESERHAALAELKKIQPAIVDGLSAENTELKTLAKRAAEYNQQLVLRLALAKKQDLVAAAIERQTTAGVNKANTEAEMYKKLASIQTGLASNNVEIGFHNAAKGTTEWRKATDVERDNIIASYAAIMASADDVMTKANKVSQIFAKGSVHKFDLVRADISEIKAIGAVVGDFIGTAKEFSAAAKEVEAAQNDVVNFAKAFSLSLDKALTDGGGDDFGNDLEGKVDKAKGIIAQLNKEVERLEKLKNNAFDSAIIADYNSQIAAVKAQIAELNAITTEYLAERASIKPTGINFKTQAVMIEPPKVKLSNLLVGGIKEQMESVKVMRALLTKELTDWAGGLSKGLIIMTNSASQVILSLTAKLVKRGYSFKDALANVSGKIIEMTKSFNDTLKQFTAQSIISISEAIGQVIGGDIGLNDLLNVILSQIANFLKEIGAQLVTFGVMMLSFQLAMDAVWATPWIAIGIGAAMVAAGALMSSLINKKGESSVPKLAKGGLAYGPTYAMVGDNPGARVDPEVIAPLSKLKTLMANGGSSNINLNITGKLTAAGRDLAVVLGNENYKMKILRG